MTVSVIIVSYNTCKLLQQCLESLFAAHTRHELEIFVVDNASADDSADMVARKFPQICLITNDTNLGFGAANNQAYARSTGSYVLLLNPDALLRDGSIDAPVEFLEEHEACGMVGGKIVNPDGELAPSARRFPNAWRNFLLLSGLSDRFPNTRFFAGADFKHFDHSTPLQVDWIPGTFTVYRRAMLENIGLFDERFFLYYEETDLCRRAAQAGYEVYFIPDAEVLHVGGACSKTRKDKSFDQSGAQVMSFRMRSEYLYFRKQHGLLQVLANAGVEVGWFQLCWLANFRPGPNRKARRAYCKTIVTQTWKALRDTRFGRISPPTPW